MSSDSGDEQVFVDDHGEPRKFILHKSIKNLFQRSNLKTAIEEHGGTLVHEDIGDVTVLVSAGFDRDGLQMTYHGDRNRKKREVYVEYLSFVQHCIETGHFGHREKIRKGMGGRSDGRSRVNFTAEDDENLCHWLAMFIPEKDAGGRKGVNIFVSLMNAAFHDPIRYAWVKRHTRDSWQERYKKNAAAFDARISEIVAVEKPNPRQLWPQDRRLNKGTVRRRSAHIELEEEEEEEEEEDGPETGGFEEEELETGGPEQEELEIEGEELETGRPEELIEGGATGTSRRKRKSGNESVPKASSKRRRVDQQDVVRSRSKRLSKGKERQRTKNPSDFEQEVEDEEHNSLFSAVDHTFNEPSSPEPQEHPASSSTPPANTALLPTQATLVGTSPTAPTQPSQRRWTTEARSYLAKSEAPYRNTRSRSRSVQPPVEPVPTKKRGTKRKTDDAGDKPPLEPVNEAFNDNQVENVEFNPAAPDDVEFNSAEPDNAPDNADVRVPETLMEEMYVEDQLLPNNSVLSALTNRDTNSQTRVTRPRTISLATDDAQTHIALRARPLPLAPSSRASSAFEIDPAHMLMQFERATTRVSLPLPNPRPPAVQTSHPSHPQQSEPFPRNLPSSTPLPSTPVRNVASRKRKESTSSVDSFPVAGTRASAAKKKLEQQEKNTPYKPPAGSRAAQRLAEMAKRGRA